MKKGGLVRKPALAMPEVTVDEVIAIKCLNNGTANKEQQFIALDAIRKKLCMIGGLEFDVDERVSALNGGKRLVALQINFLITEPLETIFPKPKKEKLL